MFKPVLLLMNRARYMHKFAIIFAVFMLPFAWLTFDKLGALQASLQSTRTELQGIDALERLLPVYRLSMDVAGLQTIAQARQSAELSHALDSRREQLTQAEAALQAWFARSPFGVPDLTRTPGAPPKADQPLGTLYAALLACEPDYLEAMKRLALQAELSLDRDGRVHGATDQFLSRLAPAYQVLAQTRTYTAYVTAYGYLDMASRTEVTGQPDRLLALAGVSTQESGRRIAEAVSQAAGIYRSRVLDVYLASNTYDEQSTGLWEQRLAEYAPLQQRLDEAAGLLFGDMRQALQLRQAADEQRLLVWRVALALVVVCIVYLFIGFYLSVRAAIGSLTAATRRLAEGDLSHSIHSEARDELGGLAVDFNSMRDRIRELIAEVVQFAASTHDKAAQVSQSAIRSQHAAARQASELALISTALGELSGSVHEISRSSHSTSEQATRARDRCTDGGAQVSKVVSGIDLLFAELQDSITVIGAVERASQEIASAVNMIRSVSEQTNLLALNAAIEAARAGEQGRGFAVVADEVRQLATRSQGLTDQIDGTIEGLQLEVGHAVQRIRSTHGSAGEVMREVQVAAQAFESITSGMSGIVQHNLQIATAAEQQTSVVDSVERNTHEIRVLSADTTAAADEVAGACDEMAGLTRDLQRLVGHFRM